MKDTLKQAQEGRLFGGHKKLFRGLEKVLDELTIIGKTENPKQEVWALMLSMRCSENDGKDWRGWRFHYHWVTSRWAATHPEKCPNGLWLYRMAGNLWKMGEARDPAHVQQARDEMSYRHAESIGLYDK